MYTTCVEFSVQSMHWATDDNTVFICLFLDSLRNLRSMCTWKFMYILYFITINAEGKTTEL